MPETHTRITIVEHVYHQVSNEDVSHFQATYEEQLSSNEQVYSRRYQITDEWKPLDLGWFESKDVGRILIKNEGYGYRDKNPSPEEIASDLDQIVYVDNLIIHPLDTLRFCPCISSITGMKVRAKHSTSKITITVFPR